MSVLDESIRQVLSVDGARSAALIDAGTGMIVGSAGEPKAGLPEAAAHLADGVRVAGGSGAGGALEEIAVITEQRCHLLEVLDFGQSDGLLLFVEVDRSVTNVALAGLQVRRLVPELFV